MATMVRLRERAESDAPVGDLLDELLRETGYFDALEAERTIEAQGRLENLQELVRVGARVRRAGRAGLASTEFLQQIALIADVDSLRDDEGLVTLMTLHNAKGLEFPIVFMIGMRGGRLPALARARRGRPRGGAAARLRRDHPRDARPHAHLRAPPQRLRRASALGLRSRFIDEIPRELTDQRGQAGGRRRLGAGPGRLVVQRRGRRPPTARPDTAGAVFRLGDDVVHAAFGEGVVTATEPGGIVVVRFAGDGSERKLMADYAPIRKR